MSGTVLSFEMGMLWPGLTGKYGDVFGLPFAMEGIAFFLEAILIAIYIYGWRRLQAVDAFLARRCRSRSSRWSAPSPSSRRTPG